MKRGLGSRRSDGRVKLDVPLMELPLMLRCNTAADPLDVSGPTAAHVPTGVPKCGAYLIGTAVPAESSRPPLANN